jgi:hypothetical protein
MTELHNVGNPRVSLMTNTIAYVIIDLDLTLRHKRCGNYKVKRLLFKLSHKVKIFGKPMSMVHLDYYMLKYLCFPPPLT